MPIITAAIVPHSPALLPSLGKERQESIHATRSSLEALNATFIEKELDTIVCIAPHGSHKKRTDSSLHVPRAYHARFAQFGDLITEAHYPSDPVLADQMKQELTSRKRTIRYTSAPQLEYSAGIPLLWLMKNLSAKLVVFHPGEPLPLKDAFQLGADMRPSLQRSQKRIGCIASGDLSHCLTENAPAGFNIGGLQFDQELVSLIKTQRTKKILKIEQSTLETFGVCGMASIAVLLGILEPMTCEPRVLSYEGSLGVGLLAVTYAI